MGISFHTELKEKIASRRLVIKHLEKVGVTSRWLMHLNRDPKDDVSLLGLIDTFVHRMNEIVRKREKDLVNASLLMQAANACLQMLACKCLLANACLQMLAANAGCACRLQMLAANACLQMLAANAGCICRLQMLAANACLQMQAANARCKCLLAWKCKSKLQMQGANFR
ncbi:hypothetical protein Tco_0128152 [Tanacetum coccineum]